MQSNNKIEIYSGEDRFEMTYEKCFYKAVYVVNSQDQRLACVLKIRSDEEEFEAHNQIINEDNRKNLCLVFTTEEPEYEIGIEEMIQKQKTGLAYIVNLPDYTLEYLKNPTVVNKESGDFETDFEAVRDTLKLKGIDIDKIKVEAENKGGNVFIKIINITNSNVIIADGDVSGNTQKKTFS